MTEAALNLRPELPEPLSPVHARLMELERHYRADRINEIANATEVREWVRGTIEGDLDLSAVVSNPAVHALVGEHGAMVFAPISDAIYECHTLVLASGRGAWALATVQACFMYMFTRTDCLEVVTRIPKGNLGARTMANLNHFRPEFSVKDGWVLNGKRVPAEWFSLKVTDWMREGPGLRERGEWFHDRLADEFVRVGRAEPNHPEDKVHDQYVGATVEMMLFGAAPKAQVFYNRWAAMAGYAPISIVNARPLCVDIQSALICFQDEGFYILKIPERH